MKQLYLLPTLSALLFSFVNCTPKNEKVVDKIEWYDLLHGIIVANRKTNDAKGEKIIIDEFERTGFPIQQVNITN